VGNVAAQEKLKNSSAVRAKDFLIMVILLLTGAHSSTSDAADALACRAFLSIVFKKTPNNVGGTDRWRRQIISTVAAPALLVVGLH
jgi:hypothetical protein